MNLLLARSLRQRGLDTLFDTIGSLVDGTSTPGPGAADARGEALGQVGSGFALLLTAVGIPMFLPERSSPTSTTSS